MRRFTHLIVLIAALALVLGACTDSSDPADETTTTTVTESADGSDEQLVFGSGEMPPTVPEDFPFPDQAVIGTTMIDRTRDLTEVIATYPANVVEVVDFFETNLPGAGYVIVTSDGTDGSWEMTFEKDDLTGSLVLDTGGSGLSQGTIRLTRATS